MIFNEIATIVSNERIADNIFEAKMISPKISNVSMPGQFINILPNKNWPNVMRRPMSIASQGDGSISIIYKIFGEGTKLISKWQNGDSIDIIGPLGNKWSKYSSKIPVLIGGGVGIAPIINFHKMLINKKITHMLIMGARSKGEHFMSHEPDKNIFLSTDIDDYGFKGNVIEALGKINYKLDNRYKIFTCGPPGMMKAVSNYAIKNKIDCDLALETIMACGIGICQGCTIIKSSKSKNTYRNKYSLACIDGPIFNIKELDYAYI